MTWQDELNRELSHAWLAGLLDGRGRFLILPRGGWQGWSPRITVPLRFRADYVPVAERLIELFGGSVGKPKNLQRQWQITGAKGCAAVNAAVMPYLVRQQRVARAHQHFCLRVVEYKRPAFDDRRLPDKEREARRKLVEAFVKAERESQFP